MTLILSNDYTEGDRYFSNVSLLLHGDGTNGSTTIVDNSPSPKTVTAFGNAQISTAQSKFGGASIAFDGTGDYLTAPSGADFDFGSNSFTIELFVRFNTLTAVAQVLTGRRATSESISPFFLYWSGVGISFLNSTNGTTFDIAVSGPASPAINTWHHIAAVRNGTSFACYLDGIAGGTVSNSSSLMSSSSIVAIGGDTNANHFNGYIDAFRITKGVARYTSNFTPPTAAFADAQF